MIEKIQKLLNEVENLKAQNAEELEALRIKYLSKKGAISALMNDFRTVPAEQKKELGMKLNELKTKVTDRINELKEHFKKEYKIKLKRGILWQFSSAKCAAVILNLTQAIREVSGTVAAQSRHFQEQQMKQLTVFLTVPTLCE